VQTALKRGVWIFLLPEILSWQT